VADGRKERGCKIDLSQGSVAPSGLESRNWREAEEASMLEMNSDKVCFVIIKAREFDVQEEDSEADSSNATDDNFSSVFSSEKDDSVRKELKAFIDGMDEDEQCELVALCWLGRGDFSVEEWKIAVAEARSRRQGSTADYLIGIPLVSDYLEEGLSKFDLSCEGFEMGRL
jgi:hypothetical protein